MLFSEMQAELSDRMETANVEKPAGLALAGISGVTIAAIIKWVLDTVLKLGAEYRDEIEQAAKGAVDKLVAKDLPWIPANVEEKIDEVTRSFGYAAIDAVLKALLGPVA